MEAELKNKQTTTITLSNGENIKVESWDVESIGDKN